MPFVGHCLRSLLELLHIRLPDTHRKPARTVRLRALRTLLVDLKVPRECSVGPGTSPGPGGAN